LQGSSERKELLAENSGIEQEVLDAAVQHAVSAHGHENSPELRDQIKSMLKNEAD
jgi:predicted small metal-binding protein